MGLSASEIEQLLQIEQANTTAPQLRREFYDKYDSAAVFLLDWDFSNLFEPTDRQQWYHRCKGCREVVTRTQRFSHHADHKREYNGIRE